MFTLTKGHDCIPINFRPEPCLDLLGDDYLVLSRLLYTLGIIMHCALHAPVRQLQSTALQFSMVLSNDCNRRISCSVNWYSNFTSDQLRLSNRTQFLRESLSNFRSIRAHLEYVLHFRLRVRWQWYYLSSFGLSSTTHSRKFIQR